MGNICDCFNEERNGPNAKTPLLTGNGNNSHVTAPVTSQVTGGQSARQFKPEIKDFETSMDAVAPINLARITSIPAMDKTFQDHAKLYNDMYANFVELKKCLHDFKAKFVADTAGIPVMAECLRVLSQRCGNITLNGSRTKNCIQIIYDVRQISKICTGPPEEVLETLELYNKANKLIRSILDKSHTVQSSINLVLQEEEKLKREVIKSDPDGKLGPGPLRITSDNLAQMHKLPEWIDTINKYTTKTFKEISEGSKALFSIA